MSALDQMVFAIDAFSAFVTREVASRDLWTWLAFFMPLVLFAEVPRYVLPALAMLFLRATGRLNDDHKAKQDFLETNPRVSVLLVGLNEEASIAKAIESLLELRYPNLEIIVVDDNSTDRMYECAKLYADRGLIKLYKNSAATGRGGRPAGSNLGLHLATGEFILSIDADTSFDSSTILHMIGPFHDPQVGIVAGNIKVRNADASIWTRMQAIEYLVSIGLWKTWLNVLGMNILASGAFGAFRRSVLDRVGGWDPELAEDACLSMKAKKLGYQLVFAPQAVAMTAAPVRLPNLVRQRARWDKGCMRTFFRKHRDIMDPRRFDWRNGAELAQEWFFAVFCTFAYAVYLPAMLIFDPFAMVFAWTVCLIMYAATSLLAAGTAISFSERAAEEWRLLRGLWFFPFYKGIFRWVRCYALALETFRINYHDSFLPQSVWRNTKPW